MAKYEVTQIDSNDKPRRKAVVDQSKVSETRAAFRKSASKDVGQSSDRIEVREHKGRG